MAREKTTTRFWLRTDRADKSGLAPVHLVYQIRGQRKYFSVSAIKMMAINWNPENQQAIYIDRKKAKRIVPKVDLSFLLSDSEVAEINNELQRTAHSIADIEKRFKLDNITFSPDMVITKLKTSKGPITKRDEPGVNIVDFIHRFVKDSSGTHKVGTLKVYTGLAAHIAAFEASKNRKLTFESINVPEIRAFYNYLTDSKYLISARGKKYESSMNNVTAAKQISTLKTLLNYARVLYKIKVNPDYRDYKVSRKDSDFEVITLTQDEFLAIYNLDLQDNSRLDSVRDVFCFSCATGLRFSDLQQLRRDHIRRDNTIRMSAAKTGQGLIIPLNPISHSILQKHAHQLRPLPIISNQKTNKYIKEIGILAKIDTPIEKVRTKGVKRITKVAKKHDLLSIHVGRKSFITLSLEKGIAIQEVMSLSGHTTFKAFRRYVDVTADRRKTVMAEAWGKIEDSQLKAVK